MLKFVIFIVLFPFVFSSMPPSEDTPMRSNRNRRPSSGFICEPMEYDVTPGKTFKRHTNPLSDPLGQKIIWIAVVLPLFDETDTKLNPTSGMGEYFSIEHIIELINSIDEFRVSGFQYKIRRIHSESSREIIRFIGSCIHSNVWFVIGPKSDHLISSCNQFTETMFMPFLTLGSTRESEDIKKIRRTLELQQYIDFMFQTVPSETFRHATVFRLLHHLGWDYVSIMISYSLEKNGMDCIEFLEKNDICVPNQIYLPLQNDVHSSAIIEDNLNKIALSYRSKILILITNAMDSRRILKLIKKLKMQERFILIFTQGSTRLVEVVKDYEDIALGALTIDVNEHAQEFGEETYDDVKKYVKSLTPNNTQVDLFHLYWEQVNHCRLDSQLLDQKFPDRVAYNESCNINKNTRLEFDTEASTSYMRLYFSLMSISRAILKMYHDTDFECKTLKHPIANAAIKSCNGKCIWTNIFCLRALLVHYLSGESLDNQRMYQFTPKDDGLSTAVYDVYSYQALAEGYRNVYIGYWESLWFDNERPSENVENYELFKFNKSKIFLRNSNVGVIPKISCSKECNTGSWKDFNGPYRNFKCCWNCIPCNPNSIVINNTCFQCKRDERADHTNLKCKVLPIRHMKFAHNVTGTIFGAVSLIGVLLVLTCIVIFIANNHKHIVKSSGRDMNYLIMIATSLLFASTFAFLYEPNSFTCIARTLIPHFAMFVCFFSLLLKTVRLFRIFERNITELVAPRLISPTSQIFLVLGLSLIQLAITFSDLLKGIPGLEKVPSSNKRYVVLKCDNIGNDYGKRFFKNSILSLLSMVACVCVALRLRNLPKSYNESKSYAMIAFITATALCILFPLFAGIERSDNYWHELSFCVLNNLIGMLVVGFFILPRLWDLWTKGDTSWERSVDLSQPHEPNMNE